MLASHTLQRRCVKNSNMTFGRNSLTRLTCVHVASVDLCVCVCVCVCVCRTRLSDEDVRRSVLLMPLPPVVCLFSPSRKEWARAPSWTTWPRRPTSRSRWWTRRREGEGLPSLPPSFLPSCLPTDLTLPAYRHPHWKVLLISTTDIWGEVTSQRSAALYPVPSCTFYFMAVKATHSPYSRRYSTCTAMVVVDIWCCATTKIIPWIVITQIHTYIHT